jgi:multiple sugar transport system substrate-binding protein
VIAGLVIPKTSSDPESAYKLIEYLTRPEVQVANPFFFPVVAEAVGVMPAGGVKLLADGVNAQSGAPDVIVSIIPGGLGPRSGEFEKIYVDTFNEIVLKGRSIQEVLDQQGALLETLWEETGAPLPVPDVNLP